MSVHPRVETLSTYLDEQLAEAERDRIEAHLESCPPCRSRLHGMRRVVRALRSVERQAPPAQLGYQVRRLALLETERPGLAERLEKTAARLNLQLAIAPIFAVVVALILIIFLFSWGLYRRDRGGVPVILEPDRVADRVSAGQQEELAEADESRARAQQPARREAADEESATLKSAPPQRLAEGTEREVAGRSLVYRQGLWTESGLESREAAQRLAAADPRVREWLRRYPELQQLESLDGIVRLAIEGQVVEVDFSRSPAASTPKDQ